MSWLSLSVARTRGCLWESSVACLIRYCFSCRASPNSDRLRSFDNYRHSTQVCCLLQVARLLAIILAYALNFVSAIECSNCVGGLAFPWSCKWLNKVDRGNAAFAILWLSSCSVKTVLILYANNSIRWHYLMILCKYKEWCWDKKDK